MATILQHFQKVISSPGRSRCPQQLVAVAKRWNSHMDQLVAVHMPYPCIVVAVPEESALYGNVQQVMWNSFFFIICIYFAVCLGLQEILKPRKKKKRD